MGHDRDLTVRMSLCDTYLKGLRFMKYTESKKAEPDVQLLYQFIIYLVFIVLS